MTAALTIIGLTALFALLLGLRARRGRDMDLEQWTVGGRGFGSVLVFLLMAGEIYTTFTFLGGSGYAYGHGGPAYYILAYGCLAYVLSYWLLPPIWRYAKQRRLVSQPDFFAAKYDSKPFGMLVAIVGIVALIPYLVLQFKGLGIIVTTASYGAIPSNVAVWIGAAVVTAYVMASGVHGSAWNAVVKDILILGMALFLGIYLPLHLYGSYGAMFSAIQQAKPGFLALPPQGESVAWFELDRIADRARLLHVAAQFRRGVHRPQRAGVPAERDRHAALPADPGVRVLRRLRQTHDILHTVCVSRRLPIGGTRCLGRHCGSLHTGAAKN